MVEAPAAPVSQGRHSLLRAASGELTFRVCGTEYDGRLVRIKSPKCALGAAAGCTLRLRSRFVRPLHCLILRGEDAVVVRANSTNTRINGRTFRDAHLSVGDRLSVGPIDLELVEISGAGAATGKNEPSDRSNLGTDEWQLELARSERARDVAIQERSKIASAANQLRQRAAEAREKLDQERKARMEEQKAWRAERARLQQECLAGEADGIEGVENPAFAMLREQVEQLEKERGELLAYIHRSEKLFEKAAERESRIHVVEERLAETHRKRLAGDEERERLSAESLTMRELTQELKNELVQSTRRHEQEKESWRAEADRLQSEIDAHRAESESLRQQLAGSQPVNASELNQRVSKIRLIEQHFEKLAAELDGRAQELARDKEQFERERHAWEQRQQAAGE